MDEIGGPAPLGAAMPMTALSAPLSGLGVPFAMHFAFSSGSVGAILFNLFISPPEPEGWNYSGKLMPGKDAFDLDRFMKAQDPVFETVLRELGAGRKQSHWMWFVFPQLSGLGRSPMAQYYGIASLAEARAYLQHPVLGERLRQCVRAVLAVTGKCLHQIFGTPDDLKFRSSMTLFAIASEREGVFQQALDRYCDGVEDSATLELLGSARL